jgi:hypothetical protein
MSSVSIRFGQTPGIVSPLDVEAPEGNSSIEELCAVLFAMRVQVLRAEEEQRAGMVIRRLGVCEFDGGALSTRRRRTIEAVLTASASGAPGSSKRAA